jgi:hypothetical protein
MAISSTTLTSCFCSGVAASINSQAPVAQSTFSGPWRHAYQQIAPAAMVVRMPMKGMTWW